MTRVGLVSRADVDDLLKAGAVGDISAHWIDCEGRVVDHPLNQRVVALSPEKLKDIPCVMIASGGKTKVPGLRGVLKGGMCDVIITDEQTATVHPRHGSEMTTAVVLGIDIGTSGVRIAATDRGQRAQGHVGRAHRGPHHRFRPRLAGPAAVVERDARRLRRA